MICQVSIFKSLKIGPAYVLLRPKVHNTYFKYVSMLYVFKKFCKTSPKMKTESNHGYVWQLYWNLGIFGESQCSLHCQLIPLGTFYIELNIICANECYQGGALMGWIPLKLELKSRVNHVDLILDLRNNILDFYCIASLQWVRLCHLVNVTVRSNLCPRFEQNWYRLVLTTNRISASRHSAQFQAKTFLFKMSLQL